MRHILLLAASAVSLATCTIPLKAAEVECPAGAKSCKVVVLTQDEINALVQPGGIFDTAQRARYLDLAEAVRYFREKIERSPNGVVRNPEGSK